jgi:hypothetical protein
MHRLRLVSRWPLALVALVTLTFVLARSTPAWAEEDEAAPGEAQPDEPAAAEPEPAAAEPEPAAAEPEPAAAEPDPAAAGDRADDAPAAGTAGDAGDAGDDAAFDPEDPYAGDEIPAHLAFDADGDGKTEPAEQALAAEHEAAFKDLPHDVKEMPPGSMTLEDLRNPKMTVEEFKNLVRLAKAKVLDRLQTKMAKKQDARMAKLGRYIAYFSLSGLLLLFLPLALKKKYPGKTAMLFKYSGLAALTFVVTVNFFGGVVLGMRTAQGALGEMTNPQLKVAEGFFDSLISGADHYNSMGERLFAPTLYSLTSGGEGEQPAVALLENGQKLMKDAQVFLSAAKTFKKIDFVFAALPIVLLVVTLLLFILAIKPTLTEIVKMPSMVAAGDAAAGGAAVKNAGRRIVGEVLATLCTVGVLVVLSLFGTFILGRLLQPALDLLLQYFGTAVLYLQLEAGASSGLVFVMLFSIIIFLALNLAAIILAMAFFLGKAQKIFQQRFNEKVPLAHHARFWKWGSVSVVVAMALPLVWMLIARPGVEWMSDKFIGDGPDIAWGKLMLVGPLALLFGFILVFWAARGVKAIGFLFKYKVKPDANKPVVEYAAARGAAAQVPGQAPMPYGPPGTTHERPSSPELPQ